MFRHFPEIRSRVLRVLFVCVLAIVSQSGATIWTVPGDRATIQLAIAAAASGDTIQVSAGTYTGPIDISKSLWVLGPTSGSAVIVPPSDFATNSSYNFSLVNFNDERPLVHIGSRSARITVIFRGFTVDMQVKGPSFLNGGSELIGYSGILADSCDVTIENDTIKNVLPGDNLSIREDSHVYSGRGIHVRGDASFASISNNYLTEINRFHIYVNASDNGTLPTVFPQATVTNNTIVGKGVYHGGQKGIWFNRGAWGTIASNSVSEIDYDIAAVEPDRASGIVTRFGYRNTTNRTLIHDNTVTTSTRVNNKGIYVQGHRDSVYRNSVSGFRWGIEIHSGGEGTAVPETTVVVNNTVDGGLIGIIVSLENHDGRRDSVVIGGTPAGKNVIKNQVPYPDGYAISVSFRDLAELDDFTSPVPVNARYNDFKVYTSTEVAQRIFDRGDTTALVPALDTVYYSPFWVPKVTANVRVYLQGPYIAAADTMATTLKTSGTLATHFVSTPIPATAVDSISIELRDSSKASASTKRFFAPAWLLSDGTIRSFTDTSKSYVELPDTVSGYFHIVVRHRNHLAIMTPDSISCEGGASPGVWNFSTGQSQAYGTNPLKLLGTKYAMLGGDCNGSGSNTATDRLSWQTNNGTAGYKGPDLNLSGLVTAADRLLWQLNNGRASQVP